MKLLTLVDQYINYRKSLGESFESGSWRLKAFVRTLEPGIELSEVKPDSVISFLTGGTFAVTRSWHVRHSALRGFYKYVISRGYADTSLLPLVIPKQPPRFLPYIYSTEEVKALINGCFTHHKINSRISPYTMRTILLLLYGSGLRIGEAISLKLADVDLNQSLLTIRKTKFYKSRFVPIGEQLTQVLQEYVSWRKQKKYSQDPQSSFFIGRNRKAVKQPAVGENFRRIREKVNIRRLDSDQQPRIHDLRHTFAVHRLTALYKEGADVQNLVLMLSVYLGHVTLAATSVYLTMTPALLEEAGHRFEQYTLKEA
jgi:integrase/recombinase XerD